MIGLGVAADVLEEFDEIGLEVAGETTGIYVAGNTTSVAVMVEHCIWESEEGSDWTIDNDRDVAETGAELREAIIGELEMRIKFLQRVVAKAKEVKLHYLIMCGSKEPIGCCSGERGKEDVLAEEPMATFVPVDPENCHICIMEYESDKGTGNTVESKTG